MLKQLLSIGVLLVMSGTALAVSAPEEPANKQRYVAMQPAFIVNIVESPGRIRYAQLALNVMTTDKAVEDALAYHAAPLRHELLMRFSQMSVKDATNRQAREALRADALQVVRTVLEKYSNLSTQQTQQALQDVLFTEFIVQ